MKWLFNNKVLLQTPLLAAVAAATLGSPQRKRLFSN